MNLLLILMFVSYPFEAFQLFAVAGYGVKVTDFLMLIFYLIFFKKFIWDGDAYPIIIKPYLQIFVVFLVATTLSGLYPLLFGGPTEITQFFKTYTHFIYILLFVPIVLLYPYKSEDFSKLIKIMLIFALIINVFGIYQVFARAMDLPFAWLNINNVSLSSRGAVETSDIQQLSIQFENLFRATSIFAEPSYLGNFNTMIMVFLIAPFILKMKQFIQNKWLALSTFIAVLAGTLATFSLTALIAVFGIVGALFVFEKRDYLKKTLIGFAVVVVFVFVADSIVEQYTETSVVGLFSNRLEGIMKGGTKNAGLQMSGESFTFRAQIIEGSVIAWKKSPFIGVGLGNFSYHQTNDIFFPHDAFWGTLAELGLIGNILFTAFFALIFLAIFNIRKRKLHLFANDDLQRLFGVAPYIMLQLFMVNFFAANFLIYVQLWFYISIVLFALSEIYKLNNEKTNSVRFLKAPLKQRVFQVLIDKNKEVKK